MVTFLKYPSLLYTNRWQLIRLVRHYDRVVVLVHKKRKRARRVLSTDRMTGCCATREQQMMNIGVQVALATENNSDEQSNRLCWLKRSSSYCCFVVDQIRCWFIYESYMIYKQNDKYNTFFLLWIRLMHIRFHWNITYLVAK